MRTLANHILRATGVAFLFFLLTSAVLPASPARPVISCTGGWFSVGRSQPIQTVGQFNSDLVLKAYAESLHAFFEQNDICSFDESDLEDHLRAQFGGSVSISLETEPCTYKYMHDMFGNLVQACVPTQELIISGAVGGAVHAWISTIQQV